MNEDIISKPKRKYKKRKKRLIRQEAKRALLRFCKKVVVSIIIITIVVGIGIVLVQNYNLRRDNIGLYQLYNDYRILYEESNSKFTSEYNYWLEKYKGLRNDYLKLLQYLSDEDLNYEIYTITAYSPNDMENQGTNNTTSIGFKLNAQYMDYINIIAVDPKVIPYGSYVFIKANWGGDGFIYEKMFIAGDCGSAIIGQRIDVYFKTKTEAINFGLQACPVKVIRNEEGLNL